MRNTFKYIHALISKLTNILYPSRCPLCENSTDSFRYAPICTYCWSQIKRYTGSSCRICALPISSTYSDICGQCLKQTPPFSQVINYGLYEGVLAEAINQFKFHGIRRLSKPLGTILLDLEIPKMDGIIPVPLSRKGLHKRGFNQSLLVARVIAKKTGIPLFMDTLLKKRETLPQVGLSAHDRSVNLKNAFKAAGNIRGMHLLLIDDVMTTGATVTECSRELLKAGAEEVIVLTLARAGIM
jgi:ComF family protein